MLGAVLITLGIAALLFALDRVAVWAEGKGWIYWRHSDTRSAGAVVMGPLVELFQPSYSHVMEEERRLLAGIEQATGEDPHRLADTEPERAVGPEEPDQGDG